MDRGTVAIIIAGLALATIVAKRLGYSGLGGNTVVRCRRGHLFTTIWIPGVSLTSIRLGPARVQRCPVGGHWSLVVPVRDGVLSDAEKRAAAEQRDVRIP